MLDDTFASGVAFVVSKSKDERLIERRRCVLEPEAEDLVGVATVERVQRFAEPHLGSVEMGAKGREQLFAAVHGGEGISMTGAPLKGHLALPSTGSTLSSETTRW